MAVLTGVLACANCEGLSIPVSCRFSTAISTITTATDRGHDGNNGDGDGSRQYHHHHHTAQPTQPPSKRRRTTPEATARLEEIKSICTHNSIIMVTLVSGAFPSTSIDKRLRISSASGVPQLGPGNRAQEATFLQCDCQ